MVAVSISLKIPDNTAYTALVALRRLGVDVDRVERSEIFLFDEDDAEALVSRITADETMFNPNKHRVSILESAKPSWGEVWIEPISGPGRFAVAWRLYNERGSPVKRPVLEMAVERLLCNPAIDRAVTRDLFDRDNRNETEY
jgi:phosphoribosylformylglycinamidine (FGAM) synthase PurS component